MKTLLLNDIYNAAVSLASKCQDVQTDVKIITNWDN